MPIYTSYAGEIAAQLDEYRSQGQKEAAAHRPPSDSLRMDQYEAALHADADKWLTTEQRLFDAVLTETSQAVVDTHQKTVTLQNNVDQLLSDSSLLTTVKADMADERGKLVAATEKRMRAEVDWRNLRLSNNISAQAVYPESHILHFGIIAVLALVETFINAFFYENAQGLLGGFFVALGVSIVNMGGAVSLGFGFRHKNLRATESKLAGWTCLFMFVVISIYCNALFAAFRSEYQLLADPTDPLQVRKGFALAAANAGRVFFLDMHIADLSSFVLFALGIFLSGFAFYKGYSLDDRYPGYGKLDRLVKACRVAEAELQELLRQRVRDWLHHRRADVQSALNEPSQIIGLTSRRIADLTSAEICLKNQAATIQRDFAMVLSAYRNANTAVRATEPPAYFRETEDLSGRVNGAGAKQLVQQVEAIQIDIKHFRETYQEPLNAKLQGLQSDSALILNNHFFEFLKDVESEAQERINRTVAAIHRATVGAVNA
jgi:hypothetical protein